MKKTAVIMAGGSGERFWPLSRRNKPKQLMTLPGNFSLLEKTIKNIHGHFSDDEVFVVMGKHLSEPVKNTGISLKNENIIFEPLKRNTTGCLALAAAELLARRESDEDYLMGVFPADHLIKDNDKFNKTVKKALDFAGANDSLVTVGIKPLYPETGYGYIKMGRKTAFSENRHEIFEAEKFFEKPDILTAKKYVGDGGYLWNSGMFFWRLSVFISEMEKNNPAIVKLIIEMSNAIRNNDGAMLGKSFASIPDISIDYALLEKSDKVAVVKGDFRWDDIGSWAAVERLLPPDENGNRTVGEPVLIDTEDCLVVNSPGEEMMSIGVVGVKNLAVIVTGDGVLVIPKDRVQEVRKVVEELKKRGSAHI